MTYEEFIDNKRHLNEYYGFDAKYLPDCLFDFQKYIVNYAVKKVDWVYSQILV